VGLWFEFTPSVKKRIRLRKTTGTNKKRKCVEQRNRTKKKVGGGKERRGEKNKKKVGVLERHQKTTEKGM